MPITQERLDGLWDFGDPARSEARLRGAAAEADGAERDELLTQVARALGLQDRFDEADAVLAALDRTDPAVGVRIDLERGRLRNSAGDQRAALPLFAAAAEGAASASLAFLRIDALHMLAIADGAHAREWTDAALAALSDESDPRTLRWRVSLHNNVGWTLFDAGRVAEALAEFERARESAERWGTPQQVVWADEALAEARASLERP